MRLRRLLIAALVAAGVAACSGSDSRATARVGHPAPAVAGTTVSGGRLASPLGHGQWVVVNFFATWCGPCQRETPQLVMFASQQATRPHGARVVGVLYLDSPPKAADFARAHGVRWPIIDDASGALASRYGIVGLPESFVVDPSGKLATRVFGGVTVAKLDSAIGSSS